MGSMIDKFSILYKYKYSKLVTDGSYSDMMDAIEDSKSYRASTEFIGSNYEFFKTILNESYYGHKNRALNWIYIKYTIKYKLSNDDAIYLANKISEIISNDNTYYPNKFTSLCMVKRSLNDEVSNTYFMIYIPLYDPISLKKIAWSYSMKGHFVGRVDFILSRCINNDEVDIDIDEVIKSREKYKKIVEQVIQDTDGNEIISYVDISIPKKYKPFGLAYMTQEERNNMKTEYSVEEEW